MLKERKKAGTAARVSKRSKPRPLLTSKEVAVLTSRFNAKSWDAMADADAAAEEIAQPIEEAGDQAMSSKPGRGVRSNPKPLPIRPGTIVWAPITPARGVKKQRRCIVLMQLPSIPAEPKERRFLVVGVTCDGGEYDPSNAKKYPPDAYFPVPHAQDSSSTTGFQLPSAAYAEFVEGFRESELEPTEGYLEPLVFDDLIKMLKAYVARSQGSGSGS